MKILSILLLGLLLTAAVTAAGRLPSFTRGVYLILADKDVTVKNSQGVWVPSTSAWTPHLSSWIHHYNVVFFTFIDADMRVPPSFESARTSGQFAPGTKIMYSLAGYGYS